MADGLVIRQMTRNDVALAFAWAAAQGWNPGIHDADSYVEADPNGFLVCEEHGEPVGCVSAIAYDDTYGFLGMYLVKPGARGRQVGLLLGLHARRYLGDRNIAADSVMERVAAYQRMGGTLAYYHGRYEGVGGGERPDGVVDISEVPFDDLLAYDRQMFPAERARFLRRWIQQPEGASLAVTHEGQLAGYGVLRACLHGYKIGPLFADTPAIADRLYRGLVSYIPDQQVFLDIPLPNDAAQALAAQHGMTQVFTTARLYNKVIPDLPLERIFGITSFELG